jgi:hypothetical protein
MTNKILASLNQAVAVAKGEEPAAAIWHQGKRYVPADRATAAEARVRELESGLKPFAQLADKYDPPEGDDDHTTWDQTALATLGDLRRARALLEDGK